MSQQSVKEAIIGTAAVEAEAQAGRVNYHVTTQWEEDVRCDAKVRNFEIVTIDDSATFGGGDAAMSPADNQSDLEKTPTLLGACGYPEQHNLIFKEH